jgi:O-antigen ligase
VTRGLALGQSRTGVWALLIAAAGAVAWASRTIASDGTRGFLEVVAAIAVPIGAWLAWARPLLFPYGLYAVLAPLDVLTQMSPREGTIARLVGIAAGAALLLYALRTRSVRTPPRAIVWLVLLCGWMTLSTIWSIASHPNLETVQLLQLAALYLIVAIFPTQKRDLVPLLAAIALGGVIAAGIGIYEFHSGSLREAAQLRDFHRLAVTLGKDTLDPNLYADGLILPFAIALLAFARSRAFWSRVALLATMALLLVAVMLAGSRDAAIGTAIVAVIVTTLTRSWRRVTLPLIVVAGAVLMFFPNVIQRAIADEGNGGSGRTSLWRVGITAFAQHPFAGTGAGSYATVYDRWYLRIFERVDPGWGMASHDIVLHYGVELGLVGLLFVVAWCVAQWMLARALPASGLLGDVRTICLASLVAFAFVAFFIDVFDVKFVWLTFALVAQARNVQLYEAAT